MADPGATDVAARAVTQRESAAPNDILINDSAIPPTHAAKKKKKKSKRTNDNTDPAATPHDAAAQVQADVLATASDLYRRIEADPAGLPDDEAYWTSLPAHLRTFIRNALPLGHLAEPGANPNALPRHASTQAMIAVAQQLAQAANASQRPMQQHAHAPDTYSSPLSLDPSMFVDTPMFADLPMGKYGPPHLPSPGMQAAAVPGENGVGSVVLVNELDEDEADFHDEFGSDDLLDDKLDKEPTSKKKLKKKKKKSSHLLQEDASLPPETRTARSVSDVPPPPPPPAIPPPLPLPKRAPSSVPPSSRAAGKLPMTFTPRPVSNGNPSQHAPTRAPLAKRPTKPNGSHVHDHDHTRVMFPAQMAGAAPPASGSGLTIGSAEERDQIRAFWHNLPEKQRKQLVSAEQQDVQRKLKEFQRHACACRVCVRKRKAIDTKLCELYATYYDALQTHLNQHTQHLADPSSDAPAQGPGPFPGSIALDHHGGVVGANLLLSRKSHNHTPHADTRRRLPYAPIEPGDRRVISPASPDDDALYDDEPLDDDEYDDEYENEHLDEDDLDADFGLDTDRDSSLPPHHHHHYHHQGQDRRGPAGCHAQDCYQINSSLTVKGILTVADDLSGNEVQKLILMMEQLAEHTADTLSNHSEDHHSNTDQNDDVDGADTDEEASITSEIELTPDEQREQGWRMFQIFAARTLEHRVLHAYRETIAQQRQLQLLRELEEEESNEKAREAKRAKENQRKKDKKRLLRQQKEEEKLRKEQERLAEEAAARAEHEKQRQAELQKQEKLRQQKEAERRQKEEERSKKEEERKRALEREAERKRAQEREREEKRRAQEERERRKKEERRKAIEAREAKKRENFVPTPSNASPQPANAAGGSEPSAPTETSTHVAPFISSISTPSNAPLRSSPRQSTTPAVAPAPIASEPAPSVVHERSAAAPMGYSPTPSRNAAPAASHRMPTRPSVASQPNGFPPPTPFSSLHSLASASSASSPARSSQPPINASADVPISWKSPSRLPQFGLYEGPRANVPTHPPFYEVNSATNSMGRMHLESPLHAPLSAAVPTPRDYSVELPHRPAPAPAPAAPQNVSHAHSPPRSVPPPIGPIERPKRIVHENTNASRPEGIFGSAALGDDEPIEPLVSRRNVPNVPPISKYPSGQALNYSSPWNATSMPTFGSPFDSANQPADPWAKQPPASAATTQQPPIWDRARFAFEQPNTLEPKLGDFSSGIDSVPPFGKPRLPHTNGNVGHPPNPSAAGYPFISPARPAFNGL